MSDILYSVLEQRQSEFNKLCNFMEMRFEMDTVSNYIEHHWECASRIKMKPFNNLMVKLQGYLGWRYGDWDVQY